MPAAPPHVHVREAGEGGRVDAGVRHAEQALLRADDERRVVAAHAARDDIGRLPAKGLVHDGRQLRRRRVARVVPHDEHVLERVRRVDHRRRRASAQHQRDRARERLADVGRPRDVGDGHKVLVAHQGVKVDRLEHARQQVEHVGRLRAVDGAQARRERPQPARRVGTPLGRRGQQRGQADDLAILAVPHVLAVKEDGRVEHALARLVEHDVGEDPNVATVHADLADVRGHVDGRRDRVVVVHEGEKVLAAEAAHGARHARHEPLAQLDGARRDGNGYEDGRLAPVLRADVDNPAALAQLVGARVEQLHARAAPEHKVALLDPRLLRLLGRPADGQLPDPDAPDVEAALRRVHGIFCMPDFRRSLAVP